ncbi:DnaB-like helicase C-terminal domain-containing protein [Sporosarcina sp. P3]|uniref:replicative DNA helicase n=1 Tax=Sporosarcina sp. P3 TaxID=2048245 RepID=UPI00130447BA|nr:DnaB-like helicase C-terminal domain-containing protein [Sporosarcina sp. P3]
MSYELAEQSLLGAMFEENYLILDSHMQAPFFQGRVHQTIYTVMRELAQEGKPVDYITVLTRREPSELGGANYVYGLKRFANVVRFDEYEEMIIDRWKKQETARVLQQAIEHDWSTEDIVHALEELEDLNSGREATLLNDYLLTQYERPFRPDLTEPGISTGLSDLDKLLNGFQDSEYIVVAARPSMGKTDVLNHFALQASKDGHIPIVFSLEMNRKTMIDRMIASTGEYNRLRMRDPYEYFTEPQKERWTPTLNYLDNGGIHIHDHCSLSVREIKAKARYIIKTNPTKRPILFIDYLQIIRPEGKIINQTVAIGQISNELKAMAKEFDCPIVVLSQLSRASETRYDKHPVMSDLRDSGNIEQDADVIALLHREDYYDRENEPTNIMEIEIAKHRNGPTGTVTTIYSKETGKIYDFDKDFYKRGENT